MLDASGYSAAVCLTLLVGGLELALSHVAGSGLIVRDECDSLPPQDATLRIEIDGKVQSIDVYLPHGVPGPGTKVAYF